jgi:hypothetical protein
MDKIDFISIYSLFHLVTFALLIFLFNFSSASAFYSTYARILKELDIFQIPWTWMIHFWHHHVHKVEEYVKNMTTVMSVNLHNLQYRQHTPHLSFANCPVEYRLK